MTPYIIHGKGRRTHQEDSYYVDPAHRYFLISDGVGGGEQGRLASITVIASAKKWIEDNYGCLDQADWGELSSQIHKDLKHSHDMHSIQSFIGSTAVIVILWKNGAHVLHVGDSRCYHLVDRGVSFWRTKDHSLVQELFDVGVLNSLDEMQRHPKKNVVTRAFTSDQGLSNPVFSHYWISQLESNDLLLLCTDGVQEVFPGDSIVEVFRNEDSGIEKTVKVIETYCQKKATDNYTALAIEI